MVTIISKKCLLLTLLINSTIVAVVSSFVHNNPQRLSSSSISTSQHKIAPWSLHNVNDNDTFMTMTPRLFQTSLFAKVQKKTKKSKTNKKASSAAAGGGFGKKVEAPSSSKKKGGRTNEEEDDFSAFPALEDSVKATMEPSPTANEENGSELSNEMYDRLAQIYGFKNFNYIAAKEEDQEEEKKEEEAPRVAFEDLITSSASSSSSSDFDDVLKSSASASSSSSSSSSSLDFADLIASASGDTTITTTTTTTTPSKPTTKLPLSSLPPFSKFRVLHTDPMVLCIDDFFTPLECEEAIALTSNPQIIDKNANTAPMEIGQSKTVGKDSYSKAQRTSTTWFHHYTGMYKLMAKASRLLGLDDIERWEEPQTVRYRKSEKFTWHLDALAPSEELTKAGGQRVATLLVYLADLPEGSGGSTMFRDLGGAEGEPLKVRPKKGSALLFFPAAGGIPNVPFDIRTLHAGEAVSDESDDDKWIAQLWLRESQYTPTAPPGNSHEAAADAISKYCSA